MIAITRRDIVIAVLIVLLAYLLRVIVVFDRAANDTVFDPPPEGSDQRHYLLYAEGWERGTWPDGPFWYQPGLVYTIVGIRALVGHSLGNLRLVLSLSGALAAGLMVGVGWLLTCRKWGGYLAGLLMAVYPVAIFFSTEPLDTGLSTFYVALFLFLALWQREKLAVWRSLLLGLVIGIAVISRANLALLWLTWLVGLVMFGRSRREIVIHATLSFFAMALPVAPVTLYNRQQGSSQLLTRVGMEEVYRGSNRDAPGIYVPSRPAFALVDNGQYTQALIDDIVRDPRRFVDLQIRKFSLFWSALEPGNNIDYTTSGEDASLLLRVIPLDFRLLALVGVLGLLTVFYTDRRMGIFLTAVILALMLGVLITWVEARLRLPIIVPLIACCAFLAVYLSKKMRTWQSGFFLRRLVFPVAVLISLSIYFDWAVDSLPVQRPVAALPADVRPLNLIFEEKLELVGWRPWPTARQAWAEYNQSYVVELYWRVLQPVSDDYNAYIAYVDDNQRFAGRDTVIGEISYHSKPTSSWLPGEIYREILGFKLPNNIPNERSGEIRVGVYRTEGEFSAEADTRTIIDVPLSSTADSPGYVTLQKLALYDLPPAQPISENEWVFGEQIALKSIVHTDEVSVGEDIQITFPWEAIADVANDYTLFIHVMDMSGSLAAQFNSEPRGGVLVTSTWAPHYPITDSITFPAPAEPGTYNIYFGLYNTQTQERLTVAAPDNRPMLGTLIVK